MKYRYMGKTGLLVSRLCLGTMTFGMEKWGCDKKTSIGLTDAFLDAGGNFIDTADRYSIGVSESIVGEALAGKKRDEIVLATKCFLPMGEAPNTRGLSRKHIMDACEASLKRLKTDYIDLYQIHGPDVRTPLERTMSALDDLVRQGKVRYIGCSNLFAWQFVKANGIAARSGGEPFSCGQYLYNLIVRDVEREILPACVDQGMGFIGWSPLAGGMLTGKYRRAKDPESGTRLHHTGKYELPFFWHDRGFGIVDALHEVSEKSGAPPARVAIAWILHNRDVTSVIIGAKTMDQLKSNLAAGDWDLPESVGKALEKRAPFDHGYPRSWMNAVYPDVYGQEEM
jgi:aryl-alcohol dehydrogenase-like predicted oxidoreductase